MSLDELDFGNHAAIRGLLETTYFPSYLHTNSLKAVIESYETRSSCLGIDIASLSSQIASLSSQLAQLQEERQKVDSKLNSAKGLFSPIRRLPQEILGYIFCFAASEMRWDASLKRNTLIFLRVCRSWRRIALATPEFFTRLDLTRQCNINPINIISLCLNHSGILPLEISL
ncbi:hypothetical protein M422DRAFT_172730, partial [Sphaerobolus stellatus SS14]